MANKSPLSDDMYKSFLELPLKAFMYTLEQVADMLSIDRVYFKNKFVYYKGRTPRVHTSHELAAVNLAKPAEEPIWRISEDELIRWLKVKRINFSAPNRVRARSSNPRNAR